MSAHDEARARDLQIEWSVPPSGAFPKLGEGEVHAWAARTDAGIGKYEASHGESPLDPEERRRAGRFRRNRDRRRFRARRIILRRILGAYLDICPGRLRLAEGEHGKPRLRSGSGSPALEFSLAHSHGLAVYTVAHDRSVGIDVERVRRLTDPVKIADRYFSPSEAEAIRDASPVSADRTFLRIWTRKEALLKGLGTGLIAALDRVEVDPTSKTETIRVESEEAGLENAPWSARELRPAPGWIGNVAVEGTGTRVRRRRWRVARD